MPPTRKTPRKRTTNTRAPRGNKFDEVRAYALIQRLLRDERVHHGILIQNGEHGRAIVGYILELAESMAKKEAKAREYLERTERVVQAGAGRLRHESEPFRERERVSSRPVRSGSRNDSATARREHREAREYLDELDELEKRSSRRRIGRR